MKRFLKIIKNKWLIKGTTTIALVAIIIGCYIGLNILVNKINVDDLDLTENKIYSLSDESKSKVENINNEISIQLINMPNETYIKDYAKKYSNLNKNIKINEIDDISSRVDLKTTYNLQEGQWIIVVKSGEKEKTLTESDMYTYDYNTYKQINRTEEAFTNAIVEVTLEEKPKIYVYTGKTINDPNVALSSAVSKLKEDSNEVEFLDILSKGNVPEDCDVLVMTTLKSDLSEIERDKILEYINNGGKILILTSQNLYDVNLPNFNNILAQYGISIGYGAIFEQDNSKMMSGSPELIVENASASFMDKIGMSLKVCLLDAGKINFDEDKLGELNVEYETIARSGEKSFIRTDFNLNSYGKTEMDSEEAESIVAARVTKNLTEDKKSELIIFSNELFASDMKMPVMNQYYMYAVDLYNNKDVVLNSISYLTKREDSITIRKNDETEKYTVTESQNLIIQAIIFIVPVVIIIAGIVVWQVRRRKK